jgi:hypothetical protein
MRSKMMSYNSAPVSICCKLISTWRRFVRMVMVAAVAWSWLPATAGAEQKPAEVSQVPTGDLAKIIEGNPDLGFVLTANFDGSINLYATENGEFAEAPVAIPMNRLGESTLFIQIFEESPGTITIYVNGMWVTIQN